MARVRPDPRRQLGGRDVALIGALLGFCLPLANTIAHSVSLTDSCCGRWWRWWCRSIVHVAMRLLLPHLKQAIEANEMAAGITAGGFARLLRPDQRRLPHDLT